jgi:carboxyl-terminal processing protease
MSSCILFPHWSLALLAVALPLLARAAEPAPSGKTQPQDPAALTRQVWAIMDVVLDKHVDPCTRQEMILGGTRALLKAAGAEQPAGLSRRVSELATEEQVAAFLKEVWPTTPEAAKAEPGLLELTIVQGMLRSVPGEAAYLSPQALKLSEQISGNRYVGIGIQVTVDKDENRVQIVNPYRRGAARQAGAKPGDLILEVDGKDTHDVALSKVVEWLRGDEGTPVTIVVRQPKEKESRTLKMIRAKVPFDTVMGFRRTTAEEWQYRIDPAQPVGYVTVRILNSGTLHDLRQAERKLRAEGVQALVIDLRLAGGRDEETDLHNASLIADALLDGGLMWRLHEAHTTRDYQADRECLFRDWPLAVLLDGQPPSTSIQAIAAALRDNHRAVVVGAPPASLLGPLSPFERAHGRVGPAEEETFQAYVNSMVRLPDDKGALLLRTGWLKRADRNRGWPVRPDHIVPLKEEQQTALLEWLRQKDLSELPAGTEDKPPVDPQLAKAVEVLRAALEKKGTEEKAAPATERR